ncbi:hypothetical protein FLP10_11450 [Agromyces intestinalis]|uniref:Nuclear transport factor 2 family protein n=1 Tax=Agromyces intestinalis TaxID=2592652 RepID=A0A5C1YFT1_9MICO|nr:hypothetical protein [Agromyces intestinalis]QEO14964.1 hypothetical protein FLP10_11450 [Agromyces intestinalis]
MPRTFHAIAATTLACVLLLTGCAGEATPTESPEPTATEAAPIFASDEEALVAAAAAYDRYLESYSAIAADGGAEPERIREHLTDEYGAQLVEEFKGMQEVGVHTTGQVTASGYRIQEYAHNSEKITVYACQDVSSTRVIDVDGGDITPTDRETSVPLVLEFVAVGSGVLLDGSTRWDGDSFC